MTVTLQQVFERTKNCRMYCLQPTQAS